jgi:hypothetical protein
MTIAATQAVEASVVQSVATGAVAAMAGAAASKAGKATAASVATSLRATVARFGRSAVICRVLRRFWCVVPEVSVPLDATMI